jgi:hypothetical protein
MNIVRSWLLVAIVSLATAPAVTQATSIAAPPQITISAADALTAGISGVPVFSWRADGRALVFSAFAVRPDTRPIDVYFGVIIPGGRTFTWTPSSTSLPILVEGLRPAGQNVTDTFINPIALLGAVPQHAFSSAAPLGLYSVFVLLVLHGADPADTSRWVAASMSPLVLSD